MKNKKRKVNNQSGAAMLIAVIFFLFISLAIIAGLVSPSVRGYKVASADLKSKVAYFLAESGTEDAYYRYKNQSLFTISSPTSITLNGNTVTTSINDSGYNQKTITSTGSVSSMQRKSSALVTTAPGVGFNYALQAGSGGISMGTSVTINGSVYSNGVVSVPSGTNKITGSATSADSAALTADQVNITPVTPTSSITFGNLAAAQDFAQSFQVSGNLRLKKVQLYIKRIGAPSVPTVRLVADNAGVPSTVNIPIGTVTFGTVNTDYGWVDISFSTNPALVPSTTYWIVLDGSTSATKYYIIGSNADSSYASGTAKTGAYSGTWNATSSDSYFQIWTGGVKGSMGGATYSSGLTVGTGSVGDAWADNIAGTTAKGHLYCTTGSNNTPSACNNTHGSPPTANLPFTAANITTWKANAAVSTQTGDYTLGGVDTASLGPKKIVGNLTVGNSAVLTLTGTVWVTGNVTISGSGKIKLPTNYALNSETIIADKIITIGGSANAGSGTDGSYLFFVSTSRCPYDTYCSGSSAISVTGAAGTIAVDAQNGDVQLTGSASVVSAVGNSLTITGSETITYSTGLASPSFINGPSGSWAIGGWGEVQ